MNMDLLLPFGLDPEAVVGAMAGLAAFGTVLAVWSALLARDSLSVRAKRMRQHQAALKAGLATPRRSRHHKVTAITVMHNVTRRLDLLRSTTARKMSQKLAQAGWRSKDAAVVYMFMKLSLPFAFGGGGFVLFNVMGFLELSPMMQDLAPLGAVLVGAYAPDVYVKNAITKREKAIQKGLPDALDLLVICAEAGLSLDAAMTRVAREVERAAPEVADEFGLTAVELGFLPERRQALENLTARCQLKAMRGVVNTLTQTEKYGTPLAQALRVLSAEYRDERMMKAEEKAARLPAIMTVPLICFILPALFVVLIGPGALRIIDALRSVM